MLRAAHNNGLTRPVRFASVETDGRVKHVEQHIRPDVGHDQHDDAEGNEREDEKRGGEPAKSFLPSGYEASKCA
jgi:hypothetical protein